MKQIDVTSAKADFKQSAPREAVSALTRRETLLGSAAFLAATALPLKAVAAAPTSIGKNSNVHNRGGNATDTITVKDGTSIYFKDWGAGQPIVFCHGWPLNADAWDSQMLFFGQHGYRVVAHDRRGHGRSGQPWHGNDMDTYADDLAEIFEKLDLTKAILIGHSTGGGEVARYIGRHGTKRVSKVVLISAVTPFMLQTDTNPHGAPISVFDGLRAGVSGNRAQFFKDLSMPFYGYNHPGTKVSEGIRDAFWMQGMEGSIRGQFECIKAFSETDFRGDLKRIDVPTLILQGEADQIVPLGLSSPITATIIKNSTLKTYPDQPHGLCTTFADTINADLLSFIVG